ncbi:serine acetyltransferase [Thermosipho ferrireducens]|uniref:Serine acetyltransferase n=1 Tax=Thermosipho ferrireducens TaxID=2571116 RepID=A0ABX7S6Y7_9BACT|nr:serine O-acetyltransferase EpsC [Thermosipho ferrireducens]QTA38351.1 serine acetyltransferase [Thermosipho ferrireducens]
MRSFLRELRNLKKIREEDIKEYLKKDPSLESKWQLFFHGGFQALQLYRISHLFYRHDLKFISYFFYYLSRIFYSVDIHPGAIIEPGVVIDHGIGTVIGSTVTIGKGTLIYHGVTLGSRNIQKGKRHPDIGRNVLIGCGASVLGPIKIGDNVQIGANSVVLSSVPSNVKVAGIPAKIVGWTNVQEIPEYIEWIV